MKMDRLGQKISAIELHNEIKAIIREDLCWHHTLADHLAKEITHALFRRLGGRETYIPVPDKSARNDRVRADFNGQNMREICAEHDISPSMVYKIIAK